MKTVIGANIRILQPSLQLVSWIRNNLQIDNPEYLQRLRMGKYVGRTPKRLQLYSIQGDQWVLPFGTLRMIKDYLTEDVKLDMGKTNPIVNYGGTDVPLYDYQKRAVSAMVNQMYGILQSKAGSGKTQMGIAMIKQFKDRALWITHTKDLLNQSVERAKLYIDPERIGMISEGKADISDGVTFATVQTLAKMDLSELRYYWDVIVCDECHRISGSPTTTTMYYKVLNQLAARHKYGLSATVHRSDGMIKATYALIGNVVWEVPDEEVSGKVMTVSIKAVDTCGQLTRECLGTDGMLNYSKLMSTLCANEYRNQDIVRELCENKGHSCLILSDRLEHLQTLMGMLPDEMKQDAVMISGKMVSKAQKEQRSQNLEWMRIGFKKYLFATYSLAKQGLDIPRLDRLFLATPHKDYAVITQSVGRIARTYQGKSDAICYDFVDYAIRYLYKAYKERCTIYRKLHCDFID